MADNRMVIVCTVCGRGHAFAKFYLSDGWYVPDGSEDTVKKFFDLHRACDGLGEQQYRLTFENDGGFRYHER